VSDRSIVTNAQIDDGTPVGVLIERYIAGPALLREAVAGMTAEQLHARPIAGKLSSQEVACHIVDSDQFMCDRMKRTIATDRPLIMGVESIDYPGPLHYDDRDLGLDLRLLEVQREQMAADLRRLTPRAWERTAVHSENGLLTLRQLLLHATRHLERHVETIEKKRAALGL
jgi:DinB superfamily